jgi:cytidine deaminase
MITKEEIKTLIEIASETRKHAVAIKSGHGLGAAIMTMEGEKFGGCNIEGVISSLGVCAEMAAIDHAVVHGKYKFKALAVVDDVITWPCGACLQYLTQFYQFNEEKIEIIAANEKGEYEIKNLDELLPKKYESKNLKGAF